MPESAPELKPQRARQLAEARPPIRLAAVVTALAVGALWYAAPASSDAPLNLAAQAARQQAFTRAAVLRLEPVPSAERQAALQTMHLPAAQEHELERQQADLARLTLWDDQAEDGDVVEIVSAGFRQRVPLAHAPVQLVLPYPGSGAIILRGIYDGGGGITVAARSGTTTLPLPVMTPGQELLLRVGR